MEAVMRDFQVKVEDAYNQVDKSHLRKLQIKMYQCATKCCENDSSSYEQVQNCVENCTIPMKNTQTYVKNEFQDYQSRVHRCLSVCNDNIKDKMTLAKSGLTDAHKKEFEDCSVACVTKYMEMLPSLVKKIKSTLDQHNDL